MRIPSFRRGNPAQVTGAVQGAAKHAPQTLTVARQRAQPVGVTILRQSLTALFAYLLAIVLTGSKHSVLVLAPLTSLLVLQVSLYRTLRSAFTKVAGVVIGVLLAVGLSAIIGFNWWSLTVTIAIALVIGYALRLGDNILEVPISAMLILSVGTGAAASQRIIETFVGTGAGLIAGFVLAPPRVQPAEEAIGDLSGRMANLFSQIAGGMRNASVRRSADDWLRQARELGSDIQRADDTLRQAEESTRLNPRNAVVPLPRSTASLREGLETLEDETTTLRLFTRSLADGSRLAGLDNPVQTQDVRDRMARVLDELSAAVRTYGVFVLDNGTAGGPQLENKLDRHLAAAEQRQDELSELLGSDPAAKPTGWPLRGEVISHLDRLRTDLCMGKRAHSAHQRNRSLFGSAHSALLRRRSRPDS
jgi:uncharacterized membrane protein YgaE (UPF0421/DUF939 family)